MPTFPNKLMNPIELYKELPKTNCGECGQKTCMAFAVTVSKGDATVDSCPHLDKEKAKSLSGSIKKIDIKEKIYEDIREELKKADLESIAKEIGAEITKKGITVKLIDTFYTVNKECHVISDVKQNVWSKILVLLYFKTGGSGGMDNQWVSFSELKGGIVKAEALKKECEIPLSELFNRDAEGVSAVLSALNAVDIADQPADRAWCLHLFPKIPVLILFRKGDDEFPASSRLLFDKSADRFLDAESLVFLCEGFVEKIEKMLEEKN